MLSVLALGLLFWCLLGRRSPTPEPAPIPSPRSNPPQVGPRMDRWSLPVIRLLTFVAWGGVAGELALGRFPLGGLLAVSLFTLIGVVVTHEMKTYASPAELALVPLEPEGQQGELSRR